MNVDPEVIARIKYRKKKLFWNKTLIVAPLVAGLVISIAMIAISIQVGRTSDIKHIAETFASPGAYFSESLMFGGLAILLIVMLPISVSLLLFGGVVKAKYKFNQFFLASQVWDYDESLMRRFVNGLEGVSIGVGVPLPGTCVLSGPDIGSVSYLSSRNTTTVCVTKAALDVPLSDHEAEAIMAHELSQILIGDTIKPPSIWDPRRLAMALSFINVGLGFAAMFTMMEAGIHNVPIIWEVIILVGLLLAGNFYVRRFEMTSLHDILLADSLAVKLTGNPKALISAIEKLDNVNLLNRIITWPYADLREKPDKNKPREIKYLTITDVDSDYEAEERLKNLRAIERGNWWTFTRDRKYQRTSPHWK